MPDLNFLPPMGSPFPKALVEPAFEHAAAQGVQTEPGPTASEIAAAAPVGSASPTESEIAAAKPISDTPTAEEVGKASKFFSPEDVARTPVMDLTQDREFSPVSWALRNPDATTDPKVLASLREVYRQRKLAGVTGQDIWEGVKGIPGAVGSLAKAALDRAANLKDIFLRDEDSPLAVKAKAESAAATESAGFGAANMARGGLQKLAHSNPLDRVLNPGDVTLWENMPDSEVNKEFFDEVGRAGQAAQTAAGEGELMRWHGGNAAELAKQGIILNPEKIASLSLSDPVTLMAFEGGFKIVNAASGAVLGTAVSSAAAQSALEAIKSGAAVAGRKIVGYPLKAAGAVIGGLGKITEKTGGAGMTIAALKLAEGELKQAAIIGGSSLASPVLKGTGKVLSDMGENLAGGHALGVGTRRLVNIGVGSADALANIGKGAALGAATASATGEDAPGMISFGGAFAAPQAIKAGLGRVVAGELVQPTTVPYGNTRSPGYGENAFLDKSTADTLAALPEQSRNKINFVRELGRKLGTGAQIYAYGTPEQGAQMITAAMPGTSPEAAAHAAGQNGFTIEVPDAAGKPRTVIFLNGAADAAGHEVGHALEKVLPDSLNNAMDAATRAQFTPEQWDALGTDYTEKLLGRKLGEGESWRDALTPAAGKLSPDTYMMREHRAENFDTLAQNRGAELGAPEDIYRRIVGAVGRGAEAVGAPLVQGRTYLGQPVSLRSMKAGESALQSVLPKEVFKQPKSVVRGPAPPPGTPEARQANAAQAAAAADAAPNTPQAGGTRSPRELLGQISEAIARGTGIRINYLSAPDEPAAATTSNRDTRRAIIEAYRTMPPEARALWEKSFFPDKVITTKGGEYQVQGWAPEVFASNAHKMAATLSKLGPEAAGLSPYPIDPSTHSFTPEGWKQLYVDAQQFVSNQTAGAAGSGVPLVVPREMEARGIFKPQVTGTAAPMEQRTADFLNTLFNFKLPETPRIVKGKVPLNVAGAAVSEATLPGRTSIPVRPRGEYTGAEAARQGIEGTPIREVNPVRDSIERATAAAGVAIPSMIETIQKLNLSNIKEVAHAPELSEFRGNTMTLSAGFQPSAEPDAVRVGAAVRDEQTGKIYRGGTHYEAYDKRREERFPEYSADLPADHETFKFAHPVTEGFESNRGEFLNRKLAARRANDYGQVPPGRFLENGLESTMFEHYNTNFKPDVTPPPAEDRPSYQGGRFQGTSGAQYQPFSKEFVEKAKLQAKEREAKADFFFKSIDSRLEDALYEDPELRQAANENLVNPLDIGKVSDTQLAKSIRQAIDDPSNNFAIDFEDRLQKIDPRLLKDIQDRSRQFHPYQEQQSFQAQPPALPPEFAGRPVSESASDLVSMPDATWKKLIGNYRSEKFGGGLTGLAWDIGANARSKTDVDALRAAQVAAHAEFTKAMATQDYTKSMEWAGRGQAAREAYEAATGSNLEGTNEGSAVLGIRTRHDPSYVPPVPAENFSGQAQPPTTNEAEYKKSGLHFKPFFSSVTKGEFGKSNVPFEPELDLTGHKDQSFLEEQTKHTGNFDEHIAKSIPTYKETQIRKGAALVDALPKGSSVLDIGASEGSLMKTVSALSKGDIHTVSLDPNPDMAKFFADKSVVPNADYEQKAFLNGFTEDDGTKVAAYNPEKRFDVVNESMAFQFISPDRAEHIAEAKRLLKPNGVLLTEQKVRNPNWATNEKFKDTEHKSKYFSGDELKAKEAKVGFAQSKDESRTVGMVDNMVNADDLESELQKNFKHVVQYWDSGNFKGYAAGDNPAEVNRIVDRMGDLNSKFSTDTTPRNVGEGMSKEDLAFQLRHHFSLGGQFQPKQPRRRDEYTMLPAGPGGLSKAWILPGGHIAQLGGMWHHHFLSEDPRGIEAAQRANLDVPPFEGTDTEGVRESAIQRGFARVNLNVNNGIMTVEARAADWNKQKSAVRKLVSSNLDKIDQLKVTLLNEHADPLAVDSKIAKLFELDTPAEKLAAIPFMNEAPRAARVMATDSPAFREPDAASEASLPPVYAAPKFAAYDKAGALIGANYNKYIDAEKAAGTGGSVRILKQVEGQAQPKQQSTDLFGQRTALSASEANNMTAAELASHFPESVIPKRRDEPISSDIRNSPLFKKAGNEDAAVKSFADKLVQFAESNKEHPGFVSGSKWYSEFVPMLKRKFGTDAPLMAELLAATSPQNAPEANYAYAVDALHGIKSGRFDAIRTKYEEGLKKLQDGTWKTWAKRNGLPDATPAAFLGEWIDKFNLKPRQSNGQLYGISSVPVLQVLARRWLENTSGPKTQNFVRNLLGTGHEATIDLWADRTMRRLGHEGFSDRWRILPKNATGVTDADFEFSQKVFREAAKQLKMKPDALQGALWFAEKHHWAERGWSRLDLGDYRRELPKTEALRSGVEQRLARTRAMSKVKQNETGELPITVEPRNLK